MLNLQRIVSYGLMTAGAVISTRAILRRYQWEEANIHAGIMLDWDDVQAVATRAAGSSTGDEANKVAELLRRFKAHGATHLAIPELTLNRLLAKGELSVTQGASPNRVYLQAQPAGLADLVAAELQIRLPHLKVIRSGTKTPTLSFSGDLPSVAEVGLGFDPAHATLADQVGLAPVARPIGYSWVQPEMIERTLDQAATLGAKLVAVQGDLIPGHEFKLDHTVAAMQRNRLTYAYFKESRHQKGDWFLAKSLAPLGLVILAHEFQPAELLEEDWFTAAYRWANLAVEAGIRLCSVRFFRILHAADPLESLAYVQELARALEQAGLLVSHAGQVDLTAFQPERDDLALAGAGLSIAGAAGLAVDLLPLPDSMKLLGVGAGAVALAGLPFLEKRAGERGRIEDHHHPHDHHPSSHHEHDPNHDPHHEHEHVHPHDHHHHDHAAPSSLSTAYAPKGLALAATMVYPAATLTLNGAHPLAAVAQALAVSTAGTVTLGATTVESDYLLGVEAYRGYNLDWLLPMGLAIYHGLSGSQHQATAKPAKSKIQNPKSKIWWPWLPLAGLVWLALKSWTGQLDPDLPATFDKEHRHAHTHHLSAFQRALGDSKMTFSPKPLRKWSLLAPLGVASAALFKQSGHQPELVVAALITAAAGQVATLTGFRNGQRPLLKTVAGRARGWAIGALIAGILWFIFSLLNQKGGRGQGR